MGSSITPTVAVDNNNVTTDKILEEFDRNPDAPGPAMAGSLLGRPNVTTESLLAEFETQTPASEPEPAAPVIRSSAPVAAPVTADIVIIRAGARDEASLYVNQGSCTMFGSGAAAYYYNPLTLARFADAIACEKATLAAADKTSEAYAAASRFLGGK